MKTQNDGDGNCELCGRVAELRDAVLVGSNSAGIVDACAECRAYWRTVSPDLWADYEQAAAIVTA